MTFPRDFCLLTARLRLRCPSREDIPHVFSATRQPGFNDGMAWDAPASEAELVEPLERNLRAWDAGEAYCFTIELRGSGEFVGRIVIRREPEPDVWNLGYWTHPRHQRQGYMSEAARAVVDFGFAELGATRIEAAHGPWNKASEAVMSRIGMTFRRHLEQGIFKNGRWQEEDLRAIDRAAWEQGGAREQKG